MHVLKGNAAPMPCVCVSPLATSKWKRERFKHQPFYGHSYTSPTPKEYALQQLGIAISNATALHIRDVKDGKLVEPTEDNNEYSDSDLVLHIDPVNPPIKMTAPNSPLNPDSDKLRETACIPPTTICAHAHAQIDFATASHLWTQ